MGERHRINAECSAAPDLAGDAAACSCKGRPTPSKNACRASPTFASRSSSTGVVAIQGTIPNDANPNNAGTMTQKSPKVHGGGSMKPQYPRKSTPIERIVADDADNATMEP
jgi:hypothetical protein